MKKIVFILLTMACASALWAQTPGIYKLPISTSLTPYYADNTIIRNYDSWYAYEYVNNCWNYTLNCFQFSFGQTMRVLIEHPEDDHPFPIQKWYSEAEKIEMWKQSFDPFNVNYFQLCHH